MDQAKKVSVNVKNNKVVKRGGGGGAAYFLGFIGAAVYFIGQADGFWPVIVAFFKACVWPAYLVYNLFEFLYS